MILATLIWRSWVVAPRVGDSERPGPGTTTERSTATRARARRSRGAMPSEKRKKPPHSLRVGGGDPRTATRFAAAPSGLSAEERHAKREKRRDSKEEQRRRKQLVHRLAQGELEALRVGFALSGPGWGAPPPPSRSRPRVEPDAPLGAAATTAELRLAASEASLNDSLRRRRPSQELVQLVQDAAIAVAGRNAASLKASAPVLSSAETMTAAILCEEYMDYLLRPCRGTAAAAAATAAAAAAAEDE